MIEYVRVRRMIGVDERSSFARSGVVDEQSVVRNDCFGVEVGLKRDECCCWCGCAAVGGVCGAVAAGGVVVVDDAPGAAAAVVVAAAVGVVGDGDGDGDFVVDECGGVDVG